MEVINPEYSKTKKNAVFKLKTEQEQITYDSIELVETRKMSSEVDIRRELSKMIFTPDHKIISYLIS